MKIFGDYLEEGSGEEYLVIHFSPSSIPLKQRWRNNGLSADFLAEYWATFFPAYDVLSQDRQVEIKGAIRYIANELLENLMKFSYGEADYPVGLGLYLHQDAFRFYASNAVAPRAIEPFQARIQALLTEDIDALYIGQLQRNVVDRERTESNLGLLTMIHDYDARLAWKFESLPYAGTRITVVTTMVELGL